MHIDYKFVIIWVAIFLAALYLKKLIDVCFLSIIYLAQIVLDPSMTIVQRRIAGLMLAGFLMILIAIGFAAIKTIFLVMLL